MAKRKEKGQNGQGRKERAGSGLSLYSSPLSLSEGTGNSTIGGVSLLPSSTSAAKRSANKIKRGTQRRENVERRRGRRSSDKDVLLGDYRKLNKVGSGVTGEERP